MKSYLDLSNDDKLKIKEFVTATLSECDKPTNDLIATMQREMHCDKQAVETLLDVMKNDGTILVLGRKTGLKYEVGELVSHKTDPTRSGIYDVWVCNKCGTRLFRPTIPETATMQAGKTDGYTYLDHRLRIELGDHQCRS